MDWIYLSPHLDDAALSCGGLIREQTLAGDRVQIWTIFTGDPPAGELSAFAEMLHARWKTGRQAYTIRRQEDQQACKILGAICQHGGFVESIYRLAQSGQLVHGDRLLNGEGDTVYLYDSDDAIMGSVDRRETELIGTLTGWIGARLPEEAEVVCPLATGNHVDHQIVRMAAEGCGRRLWYYLDYPYILEEMGKVTEISGLGWQERRFPVSERGLQGWQAAIEAYGSQLSSFWDSEEELREAIATYASLFRPAGNTAPGGVALFRPTERTNL